MNTLSKTIISGVAGTFLMTLYLKSKSTPTQEFRPPVLLNKSIDKAPGLPEIDNQKANPAGWALHYLAGIGFVMADRLLGEKYLKRPTAKRMAVAGLINGMAGVLVWKNLFKLHPAPPKNDRSEYFKHLFNAHLLFTGVSLATYKFLSKLK